jgi:hypothetical protein
VIDPPGRTRQQEAFKTVSHACVGNTRGAGYGLNARSQHPRGLSNKGLKLYTADHYSEPAVTVPSVPEQAFTPDARLHAFPVINQPMYVHPGPLLFLHTIT